MVLDIVIVTYNRLEKLKRTLEHYSAQTMSFRNLIVVNNCSNDGTDSFLEEWVAETKKLGCPKFTPILIKTDENLGGSGGFYLGQKKAMELGADWVMVADDDAYPCANLVEEFHNFYNSHDAEKFSSICAAVTTVEGNVVCCHRTNWYLREGKFFTQEYSQIDDYRKESFIVDSFSYVGSFLNAKALISRGLVNPHYFIYSDDTEHSMRLRKYGPIIVVPAIRIAHDDSIVQERFDENVLATWRNYYFMRNQFHMLLKHLPRVAYRYFWWHVRDWFLGRIEKTPVNKIENDAKWDAFLGRLGKHPIYKPGWKLLKDNTNNS